MFYVFARLGTHDELIKDLEGAYTQLIRMQGGGTNQGEATRDVEAEEDDKNISSSSSQGFSTMRSLSRGSSRSSYLVSVPGFNHIDESLLGDGENSTTRRENNETDKQKKEDFIWWRLAYLNKLELSVLILGSVAACINDVIFPLFGLLISKAINFSLNLMLRYEGILDFGHSCMLVLVVLPL